MVQFLSINFFCWISSIFVGFFKSSRFFCVSLYFSEHEIKFCYVTTKQKGFTCVSEGNVCVSESVFAYFLLVSVACYVGLHLGERMENHYIQCAD